MPGYKNQSVTQNEFRDWLVRHNFTSEHAARVLRVSLATLSRWRNGHPTPGWLPEAMANVATQFKAPEKPPKPIKEIILKSNVTRYTYYALAGSIFTHMDQVRALPAGILLWKRPHNKPTMHQVRTTGDAYTTEIIRPLVQMRVPEAAPGYFEDPEYKGLRWVR